jgi:diamine N-acetyltransferase
MFRGENIYFRHVSPNDLNLILNWENDHENWKVSSISKPYTKNQITEFVNLPQDIFLNNQLRLVICMSSTNEVIGNVDLFDFENEHHRVGIGILIDPAFREKGLASESITLILEYCKLILNVKNVFCNILTDNKRSKYLFESNGFEQVGFKKEWHLYNGKWYDEYLYQNKLD